MVSVIPVEYLYLIGFLGAIMFLSRPLNNYAKKIPRSTKDKPTDPGGIKFNIQINKEDLKDEDMMGAVGKLMESSKPGPAPQKQATGQMGMLQMLSQMPQLMQGAKTLEGAAVKSATKGG